MADENEPPAESPVSHADAMALAEEAEAQAAEAVALAAAARARARAARLRHEAISLAESADNYGDAAAAAADAEAAAHDIAEEHATEAIAQAEADDEAAEEYEEEYEEEYAEDYAEGAEDYDETAEPETVTERPRWRRWVPSPSAGTKVAAILLICAFVGFTAYMMWQHGETTQRHQREAAFVAGAKQGVVYMTSLDFNKAKEDVQRVIDSTTGEFRDDFRRRAPEFTMVVEQSKAVTVGTVNAAAVESVTGNSALVLVSATSRVTNSPGGKQEPPRMWRLRVTVTEVGGKYKMSKVEYVP
jgi:Mce-associated membrane protein